MPYVIPLKIFCFSSIKTARAVGCPFTPLSTMAALRRHAQSRPPEFDTCNVYVEAVGPAFDPERVLQRRVFFVDEDKTKYV